MFKLLCVIMCSICLLTIVYAQSPTAGKPNILIIFVDDMGYGDLGCYGNKLANTKNIDALASKGTRFTRFYVNSPVCSPSRVAMMTGQYPARHRFYTYLAGREKNRENKMPDFLPASVPTLARMMQAGGYATAHFGKWHLGGGRDVGDAPLPDEYGFNKSFTSFEGLGDRTLTNADNLNRQSERLGRGKIIHAPQHKQTEIYVDSAIAFAKQNAGKPFFIHLFPNDVHDPYNPEAGKVETYEALTDHREQQKFLAVLEEMDRQIGRLLSALEEMKVLENTLIVLTSDNGPTDWPSYYKNGGTPPCSAGDLRGRKWSLYEGGIRVPMIAAWPGKIPAGKVNNRSVMSVVDILPTIMAVTGNKLPAAYTSDGADQSAVLMGKRSAPDRNLFWYYNNEPLPGKQSNISPVLALRSGKWKLLMNADGSSKQLYNLEKDEKETANLVQQEVKLTARLTGMLGRWYEEIVE